jgi:hypothetical protein
MKPRRFFFVTMLWVLAFTSCAHVQQQFAAYEGSTNVFKGQGGTKVTSDGVDFWTTGSPPRNYQVLGILTDQRRDQHFAASSFGSDVAAEAKRVGDNAVVILDEGKEFVGTYSTASATVSGRFASGSGIGVAVRDKITRLLVIKYVD